MIFVDKKIGGDKMPSRMDKYYRGATSVKSRSDKNQDLYRTIYEEGEYTNVEGISIIEKNEKIDIEKIRELIGSTKEEVKPKEVKRPSYEPVYQEEEIEKSYDIKDVLDKAKSERPEGESKFSNTQYNILKNIHLDDQMKAPNNVNDDDLKSMIEAITINSKLGETGDLLDDLKTIHAPNLKEEVEEKVEVPKEPEIDKSFFTSSLGFTSDDFEDLKEMKDSLKTNNLLTKILLFILLVVIVTGVMFLVYHFMQ